MEVKELAAECESCGGATLHRVQVEGIRRRLQCANCGHVRYEFRLVDESGEMA